MGETYQPELWRDVFVMIGTTSGALVGLLFIVMSLHLDRIGELSDYNMRATIEGARYNILHLLTVVVDLFQTDHGRSPTTVPVWPLTVMTKARPR